MAKITIDGKSYEAEAGKNLLEQCLNLGLNLPYFCWHPALGSVGACRQCAVTQYRDENDTRGRLVMGCMTPVTDGMRISLEDQGSKLFRANVTGWLMVNHPHDCPVCDEGGECHLQDMTVMTGHNYREYRFQKRTHVNQNLGPLINHEMNRCIACYRCVRYYQDVAGGHDLQAFASHDHVYFGRAEEGVLESEFSGNLVEVCPTGVFTDKRFREHYTRKWDLKTAPSVCSHCSLGCNVTPGERYGTLRRVRSRYNSDVNSYFLCDRGRYGYEYANDERRIRQPLRPSGAHAVAQALSRDEAIASASKVLGKGRRVIGIGSPRASLESNFALQHLVGEGNFFQGVAERDAACVNRVLETLRTTPGKALTLSGIGRCDAVLVLGEDVANTAPMVSLSIRQSLKRQPSQGLVKLGIPTWLDAAVRNAIQDRRGPLFIATPDETRLDEVATTVCRGAAETIARIGSAIANAIDPGAPAVTGLSDVEAAFVRDAAQALQNAESPAIISGTGNGSTAVIDAAANITRALVKAGKAAGIFCVIPECNSMGLALLGGQALEAAFARVESASVDAVIILENDLYRRAAADRVEKFLAAAPEVIVLSQIADDTAAAADLVLPVSAFGETDGTFVNNEGRAQEAFGAFAPAEPISESWKWLRDAAAGTGRLTEGAWATRDDLMTALAASVSALKGLADLGAGADFRVHGSRVPRALHRMSGRTAMDANISVHEPKPPEDLDSPMSYSMEGAEVTEVPPKLVPEFWSPGWNSIQSLNRFQEEISGPLKGGNPGVRVNAHEPSSAYVPLNSPTTPLPAGSLRVAPLWHVFGSDELSALAPGVAELAPAPYAAMHPDDAKALKLEAGDIVELNVSGRPVTVPLHVHGHLARGLVGVPVGIAPFPLGGFAESASVKLAERVKQAVGT